MIEQKVNGIILDYEGNNPKSGLPRQEIGSMQLTQMVCFSGIISLLECSF